MPELKEVLLNRLGIADALAHRAQETAKRLQKAAHKHHDAANQDIAGLARKIEEAGIGQDEEAEQQYCRALVTRAHMVQAGHLAAIDAARMPEVGQAASLQKALKRSAVYLIRHGKTGMNSENPRDELVRGWTDVPLTAPGREEAEKIGQAAKAFGLGMILSSDLARAAETAEAIGKATGAPVVQMSEAFRPWNMGRLQGRKVDDVHRELELYVKRFPDKAVPGGESFDEFKARFLGALSHILEARDDDALPTLAIVTHSRNLKLAEAWLTDAKGDEVDPDTYLQRDAPAPGGIVRLTPSEDGWKFEELEEPYLGKALPETKVKVKVKGQEGQPDVKAKVKIKPSDDQDEEENEQEPEVKVEKAVNRAKAEAAGQGAMDFDEEKHPRAEEGTQGRYKPGEFVPKGEQQGAVEKHPWEVRLADMPSARDFDKKERANYFDEQGNKIASSREKPQEADETPLGTWRKDDFKGSHGTEVEQLRELDPNDIIPSEDTGPERKADVERYAQWAREGRPAPPIKVVETDNGKMKVYDGHRRWLAAKKAGTKVRAWVSPAANIPELKDSEGRPMKTGLTHELAIHHAIEAGHRVPDEVLADYPELKAKHDQQRKETLRVAAQKAEEDGHPGLAEAHRAIDPKEDWQKNGVRSAAFKSWFGDWENDPEHASKILNDKGEPQETYPFKVYHGTKRNFTAFDPEKLGEKTQHPTAAFGFFFSESEVIARTFSGEQLSHGPEKDLRALAREHYGKDYVDIHDEETRAKLRKMEKEQPTVVRSEGEKPEGAHVIAAYLNLRNPYHMPIEEWNEDFAGPSMHISSRDKVRDLVIQTRKRLEAEGHDGIVLAPHPGAADRPTNEYSARSFIAFRPEQIKSVDNEGTFDPTNPNMNKAVRRPFVPPDVPHFRVPKPSPDSYLPLNGVEDREKFMGMVRQMAGGHWTWDIPLIRCGDQLLTGSHRYAAAKAAGVPVETMDAADLFREGGLDFKETWERHAQPFTSWLNNMDCALKCLPEGLREKYGVDLG